MKNLVKYFISHFLSIFGLCLVKKTVFDFVNDFGSASGYDLEKISTPYIKIVRKNTMLPFVNLVTLFEQAKYCEDIALSGDFVECGVWKGGATGLMALVNLNYSSQRRTIHLFDAFSEICAPDTTLDGLKAVKEVEDALGKNSFISGEMSPLKGIYDRFGGPGSLEENKQLLEHSIKYPADKIQYHIGWFQDTVPDTASKIDRIAILRLDGDWYASTKVCLDYLYDKVVDGGFIIVDDYGCYEGCKKAVDEFLEKRKQKVFMHYSSSACRYWIKRESKFN